MSPPLTFGVELEFSLGLIPPGDEDPHPNDPRRIIKTDDMVGEMGIMWTDGVVRLVAETLLAASININATPGELFTGQDSAEWRVTTDGSVFPDPKSPIFHGYRWFGMEVISPVLYFCEENLRQIEYVCKVLTGTFRIVNFPESGLHIHVGNGRNGFHLESLQKQMAFLWAFSPQLDSLHTRVNADYAASIRKCSRLWEQVRREALSKDPESTGPPSIILAGMEKIFQTETPADLLSLFSLTNTHSDFFGDLEYRFGGLVSQLERCEVGFKRTMEWRQHSGTLEGEAIVAWIRTVIGITDFCLEVEDEVFHDMIERAIRRELSGEDQPHFFDILESIGISDPISYYQKTKTVRDAIRAKKAVMEDLPKYRKFQLDLLLNSQPSD